LQEQGIAKGRLKEEGEVGEKLKERRKEGRSGSCSKP